MNYPIIFRLLSNITYVLCSAFVICLGVAFIYRPEGTLTEAIKGFGTCLLITLFLGTVFRYLGRNATNKIFRKEALTLIGLSWILASLVSALPYYVILEDCHFIDAWFESVSGVTTTGATVFGQVEHFPRSLMFWRCFTQWIGGLGVVVLFVALLANLGSGAKFIISNESSSQSNDLDDSSMVQGAKRIMLYYIGLSVLCVLTYKMLGQTWFDSVCHMFTSVASGGFSTMDEGVAAYEEPALEWAKIIFMYLAGLSFLFVIKLIRQGKRAFSSGLESFYYTVIILGATAIIVLYNDPSMANYTLEHKIRAAMFQVVSISTTTGYATEDFAAWANPLKWILIFIMTIGGCSSSTAGGIKVIRLVAMFRVVRQSIEKTYRARVVRPLYLNGKAVDETMRDNLYNYLIINAIICLLSIGIFSFLQPEADFETSLSAVFASLFNIGPGLGEVGPTSNFGFLETPTKFGLSVLMILGRLEIYALIVLFSPSLWRKFS